VDICPDILRQRLIIEGIFGLTEIDTPAVQRILGGLTRHLGMTPIADTLVFSPDAVSRLHHGVGGFQAWAESGCSLYTWRERRLFTLDVYSCKGFEPRRCVRYVEQVLQPTELDWRLV
jgi:S-adenosylmethionine decarboxylase